MKKFYTLSFILLFLISIPFMFKVQAQEQKMASDSTLVGQCIQNLFDGMRAADSAKVHLTFRDDVRMVTSFAARNGKSILNFGDLPGFLEAVAEPKEIVWDERIYEIDIRVDDNMAQVWTEYEFFLGERFSHCGVNAFQLIKQNGAWKIFNLTDTRRKEGCKSSSIKNEKK